MCESGGSRRSAATTAPCQERNHSASSARSSTPSPSRVSIDVRIGRKNWGKIGTSIYPSEDFTAPAWTQTNGATRPSPRGASTTSHTSPSQPASTRRTMRSLSLHRAYPEVANIGVYTGGSEVELRKALYQLNLLSKATVAGQAGLTVEEVVRQVLPGMKRPRRIEEYLRNGVINRAHFCAAAEIRTSESVRNERQSLIETVGLSYRHYKGLLDSPYAGATYISCPAAVGAAILAWQTLEHIRTEPGSIPGGGHGRGPCIAPVAHTRRCGAPRPRRRGHRPVRECARRNELLRHGSVATGLRCSAVPLPVSANRLEERSGQGTSRV